MFIALSTDINFQKIDQKFLEFVKNFKTMLFLFGKEDKLQKVLDGKIILCHVCSRFIKTVFDKKQKKKLKLVVLRFKKFLAIIMQGSSLFFSKNQKFY